MTMTTREAITERVRRGAWWNPFSAERCARRGARLLGRTFPHWNDHVDAITLNVADDRDCPLGQIYGDFMVGIRALFPVNLIAISFYGFMPWPLPFADYCRGCERLTAAWLLEIRLRLEPAPDEDETLLTATGQRNCPVDVP